MVNKQSKHKNIVSQLKSQEKQEKTAGYERKLNLKKKSYAGHENEAKIRVGPDTDC